MDKLVLFACTFLAVVSFVLLGISLFTQGWAGYEEKYIKGAERTFDTMFLTIPGQVVLYLSVASAALLFLLAFLVTRSPVGSLAAGAVGLFLPEWTIRSLKRRRARTFNMQLVDALATMSNALRSGYSLPATFDLLRKQMGKPFSQEINLVVQELRLGVPPEEALRHMHARMPGEDLDLLITAIVISGELGGNLAEVLDKIAYTIRERWRIEGKIASLTAQGKLQSVVIALLPVAIFLAVNGFNPAYMKPLYTTWSGWLLIAVTVGMDLMGFFVIRKMTSIRV